VGVALGGHAVGGPAGVGDADLGAQVGGIGLGGKLGDAADSAQALQLAVLEHGEAGGVIAPVFELAQALKQHGDDVATGNGGNDATHGGGLSDVGCCQGKARGEPSASRRGNFRRPWTSINGMPVMGAGWATGRSRRGDFSRPRTLISGMPAMGAGWATEVAPTESPLQVPPTEIFTSSLSPGAASLPGTSAWRGRR
jgi:hypothetical protein